MEKIPVHIISGFLGAGKTTAIIRLLERKPKHETWAVIINEFGKISIDGQTLQSKSSAGSLFEISGGCICCSARSYFQENLEKIMEESRFDRIIIEPSGLGGIDHITGLVQKQPDLLLMPVVCIVDMTTTYHPRLSMLPIYKAQIKGADLVLFSKTELLQDDELTGLIDKFSINFPGTKYILPNQTGDSLFHVADGRTASPDLLFSELLPAEADQKNRYREYCLKISGSKTVDIKKLTELLQSEDSIIRAKGYIYAENEWVLFNYTLAGISTEKCLPKVHTELVVIHEDHNENKSLRWKDQLKKLIEYC